MLIEAAILTLASLFLEFCAENSERCINGNFLRNQVRLSPIDFVVVKKLFNGFL